MTERPAILAGLIRVALLAAVVTGVLFGRWSLVFVGLAAFTLTLLPQYFAYWMGVRLPRSFLSGIVFFIFATIFLGEAFDFYERYWWWDIALHFGSAVSFGLFGFLFIFMLFEGDRYAAPPWAVAFLSFCVAITVGALWEIFEFGMDQIFGLNMQKSGLIDTMYDLIMDTVGGALGACAGYLYLKGKQMGGLGGAIEEFIRLNRKFFGKIRDR
ncbi:hypothetical protein AADZ90_009725 [Aestuariibius sp. 2305UL40-4]|uniref:hypothetical protein n=1 Tax=Aestuariibius violaceus TaxID=3234132 RepID=UPI00345E9E69